MFGSVDEAHAVFRIAQEFLARFQVFKDTGFVLFSEIAFVPCQFRNHSDKRFGHVGVELITDEYPSVFPPVPDCRGYMPREVLFVPCLSDMMLDYFPCSHFKRWNQ